MKYYSFVGKTYSLYSLCNSVYSSLMISRNSPNPMLYLLLSVFEPWWHSDHTLLSFHFSSHSWYEHFWWNHRPDQLEKSWQRQRNCPGWVCSSPDVAELDKLTIAFWNPFLVRLDLFQKLLWFSYQLKRPHVTCDMCDHVMCCAKKKTSLMWFDLYQSQTIYHTHLAYNVLSCLASFSDRCHRRIQSVCLHHH